MALNFFGFQKQIMIDTFSIKLTQSEKPGLICGFNAPLTNLKNEILFDTRSRSKNIILVYLDIFTACFDTFKRKQKSTKKNKTASEV